MSQLFRDYKNLKINKIILYETPNCYTVCINDSLSTDEVTNWLIENQESILEYIKEKGIIEYDDRK